MRNDPKCFEYCNKNKKKLLKMKKEQQVRAIKGNMSSESKYWDGKNIKSQYVRKRLIDSELRGIDK